MSYTLFSGSLSLQAILTPKAGPLAVVAGAQLKNESKTQRVDWDAMLEKLGLAGIRLDPMQSLLMDKARLAAHLGTPSYSR